jgi:hypothetical protein
MGRIITQVTIENPFDKDKRIRCDVLVDTGTSFLVLPSAWRERLGNLEEIRTALFETAVQETGEGAVCGPVRLQIEGFAPIFTEVVFVDMHPEDGDYEPLLGYIPLEQSQVAVDVLGRRLVKVKAFDLK